MEKRYRLTFLYDFYGELLTEKQRLVYEMYYQNDLSLGEIAQELSVSRQAVSDQLRRTEGLLEGYEDRLGLWARFQKQKLAKAEIKEAMSVLFAEVNTPEAKEALLRIQTLTGEL